MKQLLAGVVILFVVGIASFLYRNTVERPGITAAMPACTMEAKICPDGTPVGRTGSTCEFAPCAYPNVEMPDVGINFVVPENYSPNSNTASVPNLIGKFGKANSSGAWSHAIVVYQISLEEDETGDVGILRSVRYQPSDMPAEDFSRFETETIGGRIFRSTVIERFEGLIHSAYFLVREKDILRFDIVESDVVEWTDSTLDIRTLPEHAALLELLRTLQTTL